MCGDVWLKALLDIINTSDDSDRCAAATNARNKYKDVCIVYPLFTLMFLTATAGAPPRYDLFGQSGWCQACSASSASFGARI